MEEVEAEPCRSLWILVKNGTGCTASHFLDHSGLCDQDLYPMVWRGATSQRAQQHSDELDFKGRVSSSLPREGMAAWHVFSTIKVRACWLVFHLAVTIWSPKQCLLIWALHRHFRIIQAKTAVTSLGDENIESTPDYAAHRRSKHPCAACDCIWCDEIYQQAKDDTAWSGV